MACLVAWSTAGEGASSITFWYLRCREQSLSLRWMAPPCASQSTWISTCLARVRSLSMYTVPSPNAAEASLAAASNSLRRFLGSDTERIPFPPPPARASPGRCAASC